MRRHASAATIAKSPARRLNSSKPQCQLVAEMGKSHLDDHLALAEVGRENRFEERAGRNGPRQGSTLDDDIGIEGDGEGAPFRSRIGMGDAASKGTAQANGQMRDVARDLGRSTPSGPSATGRSNRACRANAPITSLPSTVLISASPGMRLMSTSVSGRASRKFIAGTRLWPPARTRPSGPDRARISSASARVFGAK
jgi:hypothetical protein